MEPIKPESMTDEEFKEKIDTVNEILNKVNDAFQGHTIEAVGNVVLTLVKQYMIFMKDETERQHFVDSLIHAVNEVNTHLSLQESMSNGPTVKAGNVSDEDMEILKNSKPMPDSEKATSIFKNAPKREYKH